MLINTYLDQDCFHKLEELTETTHASISDVLKQAIDFYYEQVKPPQPHAAEMLLHSGFVGCGEAEPTWSEKTPNHNLTWSTKFIPLRSKISNLDP